MYSMLVNLSGKHASYLSWSPSWLFLRGVAQLKRLQEEEVVKDWNIYKYIMCLVFWFVSIYHSIWSVLVPMVVYVITDTHGLRVAYEDQMTPKFTKLYVQCESEAT